MMYVSTRVASNSIGDDSNNESREPMKRLLAFTVSLLFLVGCDSLDAPGTHATNDAERLTSIRDGGSSANDSRDDDRSDRPDPFGSVCSPAQGGRLILGALNGYQFISRSRHGRTPVPPGRSYAIKLQDAEEHRATLTLYRVGTDLPLVLVDEPVQAALVEQLTLQRGGRVHVAEIDQVFMWPGGLNRDPLGVGGLAVVTHPGSTAAAQNPDRPTDTDSPIPQWICEDPDLLGSIDLASVN